MIRYFLFGGLLACSVLSCNQDSEQSKVIDWNKKKSTSLNRELVEEEKLRIKIFLGQHPEWNMQETGSGLFYEIYHEGQGAIAKPGNVAKVTYKISLLDGTECYATKPGELKEFVVDKSEVETGIQEGIKKMNLGAKARFIVPSHLGHGLTGDFNKIPPLSIIIIEIELKELK